MQTIGIIGGTGFTGSCISSLLNEKGYKVIIFTRNVARNKPNGNISYAHWNADKGTCDINALKQLDTAIHLAGAGIADKRWTPARKEEILTSRVKSTSFLIEQLRQYAPGCKTFISASAIGFYGPDGQNTPFDETAAAYPDFLGDTCKLWEAESHKGESLMRTVILRFGIVLGKESGAFPQLAGPLSFGVMPIAGGGEQVMSWIELSDLAGLVLFAVENAGVSGTYNAVSPNPVKLKDLMRTIAKIKGGIKIPVPVPAFILKIVLGELSIEVLKSCTVSAAKIEKKGFKFRFPLINDAVKHILAT
ncbi:MAG: TIGR01777 family protein [Taibaiella sp.]|nr:TIGR01777 family protein [Taibaiella sp.]